MNTDTRSKQVNEKQVDAVAQERAYCAQSYAPLPVVLSRGEGAFVYDAEGRRYYDFLSAYSAVSQGHCHPEIVSALKEQADQLTLTSRAFYNDALGPYGEYMSAYFGFDQILPMNTGAEAVETAIKIARKWGYEKKGIPDDKAKVVVCSSNFHGRTMAITSFSTNPVARKTCGPFMPGFEIIPFNDTEALEVALKDPNVAAFLVEPIQGEAGVVVPHEDYMPRVRALTKKYNVLLIVDEIQTGLGRTGGILAVCGSCSCRSTCEQQESYVRPDLVLLGKALSGGVYPVSAVLGDREVMSVITPGTHGSTYGGNPLACRVAMSALEVIKKEHLPQRARKLGQYFRRRMRAIAGARRFIVEVRGRGMLNSIEINHQFDEEVVWQFCIAMRDRGLLAKPTHGYIIRTAPPLVITEKELETACDIIEATTKEFEQKAKEVSA